MAERQSRPMAEFPARPEYSLDSHATYELFHAALDRLDDVVLETIPTRSSLITASSSREETTQLVRATHHGPLYGDESQPLFSEESNGDRAIIFFEPLSFDTFAKIAIHRYRRGPQLSEAVVSIRDFPPGSADPLVTQYVLSEFRGGGFASLVTQSMPSFEGYAVELDEHPMAPFDYTQLFKAVERIQIMRRADSPALGQSALERTL